MKKIKINNLKDLSDFSKFFLEKLQKKENKKNAKVVILNGDLGSGKTTFVKNIAQNLEIKENINSPTFTISKKYKIKKNDHLKNLIHLDLYRLNSERELSFINLENDIENNENIIFIEWPEIAKNILPKNISKININYIEKDKREINFEI